MHITYITYVWMCPYTQLNILGCLIRGLRATTHCQTWNHPLFIYRYPPWNVTWHNYPPCPQKETVNDIHFQMLVVDGSEIPNNQPPGMYKLKPMEKMGETSPNLNWLCSQIPKKKHPLELRSSGKLFSGEKSYPELNPQPTAKQPCLYQVL